MIFSPGRWSPPSSTSVTAPGAEAVASSQLQLCTTCSRPGESPAEAARLIHSRGLLYAIDVNDNFRGWDDDLVVGSVHLVETLEFFYTLRECGWNGVWQLDQFPFREDSVGAARAGIETMRSIHRALDVLDVAALREAQDRQDALAAGRIARRALLSCEQPAGL